MKRHIGLYLLLLSLLALLAVPAAAEDDLPVREEEDAVSLSLAAPDYAAQLGMSASDYQRLLGQIDVAIAERKSDLDVYSYGISRSNMNLFIDIVKLNNANYYAELGGWHFMGDLIYTLDFNYLFTPDQCRQIEAAASRMLEGIENSSLTAVEKALLVHDRLAVWCEYDSANYYAGTIPQMSYTMYGTLINRISVCQGYAETYRYLMNRLGIPTRVTNSEQLNHAWNIVTIDGVDYHVDVTHDDPIEDIVGRVSHKYFLLSSAKLDEVRGHAYTDYDHSPQSAVYEGKPWSGADSPFVLLNGKLYFMTNGQNDKSIYEWNGGSPRKLLDLKDYEDSTWYTAQNAYWMDSYGRLSGDGSALYFSLAKNIFRYVPGSVPSVVHSPEAVAVPGTSIFGFRAEDGWFIYRIGESPSVPRNAPASTLLRYNYLAQPTLTGIRIKQQPAKTSYFVGETQNLTGLRVELVYSDGTTKEITDGYTVSGFDSSSEGTKTLNVTYDGKSASFTVTVAKAQLVSIRVKNAPTRTTYFIGEALKTDGLVVTAIYSDGSSKDLTEGWQTNGFSSSAEGEKTVTVTYQGKTATFTVTVVRPTLASVSILTLPDKVSYKVGDKADTAGLKLRLTYTDGSTKDVADGYTVQGLNTSAEGTKTVTVTYEGKTASFEIMVTKEDVRLTSVRLKKEPTKKTYYVGDPLDPSGMVLSLLYSDGSEKEISSGFEILGFDSRAAGNKTLTADYGGKTVTFTVTVRTPSVSLDKTRVTLKEGETLVLNATADPADVTLTWSVSDRSVLSVEDGVALKAGTADVTVSFEYRSVTYRATCRVTVTGAEDETGVPETSVPETQEDPYQKEIADFIASVDAIGTVTPDNYVEKSGVIADIRAAYGNLPAQARAGIPASVLDRVTAAENEIRRISDEIRAAQTDPPGNETEPETESGETTAPPAETDPTVTAPVTDPAAGTDEKPGSEKGSGKILLIVFAVILVLLLLVLLSGGSSKKKSKKKKS